MYPVHVVQHRSYVKLLSAIGRQNVQGLRCHLLPCSQVNSANGHPFWQQAVTARVPVCGHSLLAQTLCTHNTSTAHAAPTQHTTKMLAISSVVLLSALHSNVHIIPCGVGCGWLVG